MQRFKTDKLIRDKMPDMLARKDIIAPTQILDHAEYKQRLKDKLIEEAEEVKAAQDNNEYLEELADVLEVIHALAKAMDLTFAQIEEKRILKRAERGGFDDRIYNPYIEMKADNSHIDYYRGRVKEYPEIK